MSGMRRHTRDHDDIAGYLEHRPETPQPFHLFLLELTDVVLVSLDGDRMLMQTWRSGRRITRTADGPAEVLA